MALAHTVQDLGVFFRVVIYFYTAEYAHVAYFAKRRTSGYDLVPSATIFVRSWQNVVKLRLAEMITLSA